MKSYGYVLQKKSLMHYAMGCKKIFRKEFRVVISPYGFNSCLELSLDEAEKN